MKTRQTDRGRLTLPDVLFLAVSVAFLGAVAPVFYSLLGENAGQLGTGEQLLWQAMIPGLIVVMLAMIYVTAVGGAGGKA